MNTPRGSWGEVTVEGHRCEFYHPPRFHEHGFVAIYLHDSRGTRLAEQKEFVAALDRHGLIVIAPHTGSSWWTGKICPGFDPRISAEQYVMHYVLPFVQTRWEALPPKIGVFGVGMGAQGALRLAYKYPDRFPVVAAVSPTIDFQTRFDEGDESLQAMYPDREAARQDTALLHIHPLNWPRHQYFACDPADVQRWDSADRLRMKLWSLGIPFQCDLETSSEGQAGSFRAKMAERTIAFLVEHLEKERLRLV